MDGFVEAGCCCKDLTVNASCRNMFLLQTDSPLASPRSPSSPCSSPLSAGKNERSSYSYGRESNPHCHQVSPTVNVSSSGKIRKTPTVRATHFQGSRALSSAPRTDEFALVTDLRVSRRRCSVPSQHLVLGPWRDSAQCNCSQSGRLAPCSHVSVYQPQDCSEEK